MVLLLRKLYLYFTKDQEVVHYFQGGGLSNFFQGRGPNDKLHRNPYTYLLFSRGGGGGCPEDPYPHLNPHMCNVNITRQYLSQSRF